MPEKPPKPSSIYCAFERSVALRDILFRSENSCSWTRRTEGESLQTGSGTSAEHFPGARVPYARCSFKPRTNHSLDRQSGRLPQRNYQSSRSDKGERDSLPRDGPNSAVSSVLSIHQFRQGDGGYGVPAGPTPASEICRPAIAFTISPPFFGALIRLRECWPETTVHFPNRLKITPGLRLEKF